jgi:hypothetical protein
MIRDTDKPETKQPDTAQPRTKNRANPAKQGDAQTLVDIDNPDDAEFGAPLDAGDEESLVKTDSPDDGDDHALTNRAGDKTDLTYEGRPTPGRKPPRRF